MSGAPVRPTGLDQNGNDVPVSMFRHKHIPLSTGMVVFSDPLIEYTPQFKPFLNPSFGTAMNQNISFGAIASTIHDGGTTSSADTGTADTDTLNKLVQTGQNFQTTCVAGMSVHNTTDDTYGNIGAVDSDTALSIVDSAGVALDLFPDGNEAFIIDAVWIGLIVSGSWNFADTGKISLTAGNNNDQITIGADPVAEYDMDNFTAFTGKITLTTYSGTSNNIAVIFDLNGVPTGNSINLNDFIDTGDFAEQNFVIPKASLGLESDNVNGMTITVTRSAAGKPTFTLDDLHLEASGTPAEFSITAEKGERFAVDSLRLTMADNITGIVTGSTTTYPTMAGLSYNKILGVTELSNPIVFQRRISSSTDLTVSFTKLSDFSFAGFTVIDTFSDGTNTMVVMEVAFSEPLIIDGDKNDFMKFIINDNLSGLLEFRGAARGAIEIAD